MRKPDLSKVVTDMDRYDEIQQWMFIAYEIMFTHNASALAELVEDEELVIHKHIDFDQYELIHNVEPLIQQLVMNIILPELAKLHAKGSSVRGPKSNRIRQFFDVLTTEPMDMFEVEEYYGLSQGTLKNHRKYDPFKERGLTVTKNYMIYRLPIDNEDEIDYSEPEPPAPWPPAEV